MAYASKTDFSSIAIREYLALMHEVDIRINLVAQACAGKMMISPFYAQEFAYLQFRYICEIIALGCLHLHGIDLPNTRQKANGQWHAEKIMQLLHSQHSHVFPQSLVRSKCGSKHNFQFNAKPNALTRKDFKKLYEECGEVLHKGTLKKAKPSFMNRPENHEKILQWQSKLVDLMNEHGFTRPENKGLYIISLRTSSGFPECSALTFTPSKQLEVKSYKIAKNS